MLPKVTGGVGRAPSFLSRIKARTNKYGVSKKADRTFDGIVFASKEEMKRYAELRQLQYLGVIEGTGKNGEIECQPRYPLLGPRGILKSPAGRQYVYVADFRYRDKKTGEVVVEDVKGADVPHQTIKRMLAEQCYGITVILPNRRKAKPKARRRRKKE